MPNDITRDGLVEQRASLQAQLVELDREEASQDLPMLQSARDALKSKPVTDFLGALQLLSTNIYNPIRKAHIDNIVNSLIQGTASVEALTSEAERLSQPAA